MKTLEQVYATYNEWPEVPAQYLEEILHKPVAKRQMQRTSDGFLPGQVIMLWRVQFGSYLTTSPHHKYFATTYGINAQKVLENLMSDGYVRVEGVREALRHIPSLQLKNWLKEIGITGLSKMKRADLDQAVLTHFSDEQLADLYQVRAYLLTDKGKQVLERHPDIVAKHPQKKF